MANIKTLNPGNHGQGWKPGQSGNPSGRGIRDVIIREFMECKDRERMREIVGEMYKAAIGEDAIEVTVSKTDKGIFTTTKRFKKKSPEFARMLLEFGYGKAAQPVEGEIEHKHTLSQAIEQIVREDELNADTPAD